MKSSHMEKTPHKKTDVNSWNNPLHHDESTDILKLLGS